MASPGKEYGDAVIPHSSAEDELRKIVQRLRAINQLHLDILAARSPREIAETVLTHLRTMLPSTGFCALLLDLERQEAVPLAMLAEFSLPLYDNIRLAFQCDSFVPVLNKGETVVVSECNHGTPCAIQQALAAADIYSLAAVPLRVDQELIGAVCGFARKENALIPAELAVMEEIAVPLALALQNSRLLEKVSRHRQKLQGWAAKLYETEEREKHKLAEMLHDKAAQQLTALGLNLDFLLITLPATHTPDHALRLSDSRTLVDQLTDTVRDIMTHLRPPVLDDYGLRAALRWYVEKLAERTDIPIQLEGEEPVPRLDRHREITLFRVAQEAIINAIQHAAAERITINLVCRGQFLRLQVLDSGKGFRLPALNGKGLIIMQERMDAIRGRLRLLTSPGQGTKVIAEVPL